MPRAYQSIQFAPDGDYITDYHAPTINEIWNLINDQGSRWYFYPLPFVITDGQQRISHKRILSCPHGFEHYKGSTVDQVKKHLATLTNDQRETLFTF